MDTAPAHTATATKECLTVKDVKTLPLPPHLPDLAPADFFLFHTGQRLLAGQHIAGSSVQKDWDRVCYSIPETDFAMAFEK